LDHSASARADLSLHHPALFEQRSGLLNLGVRESAWTCSASDDRATNNRSYHSADWASDDRSGDRSGNRTGRSTPLIRYARSC
jgi:hypothetical protein